MSHLQPEYCALLDGSKWRQQLPHVLLELTLAQHPDKQLAVISQPALNLHRLAWAGHQLVHLEQKRLSCRLIFHRDKVFRLSQKKKSTPCLDFRYTCSLSKMVGCRSILH